MKEKDVIRDLAEIRSMMERSSKFLSLSGWAGIMAGIYALAGSSISYYYLNFNPVEPALDPAQLSKLPEVISLAVAVLVLAVGTAAFLSRRKAERRGETAWNATSRRMILHMAVPLAAGGIFIIILISKGFAGFMAPATLLFYGLALYSAGTFTYNDLKFLGLIQIVLGLAGSWFIQYGLLLWAIGFGIVHIGYGIYMYVKYER